MAPDPRPRPRARPTSRPIDTTWPSHGRDLAHQHGALLIFDEIVTGFRIARGGGQELFGVMPDLAAFGKAMANGWPISAVVGRRVLLRRWPEIGVDMTWRSETLSLVAARVVLDVLARRPVLSHLAAVGDRLRSGFASAARTAGVDATLTGPSARLTIAFRDQAGLAAHRLLEQFLDECLRRGVVTNGTLLPNAAHDERATERTVEVFRQALAVLGRGVDLGRLEGPGAPRGPWIQGCVDQASERAGRVELAGWLLAEDGRSLTIDLVAADGQVIPAERVRRTDVAAAFPWTRGAQECGWSVRLPPAGREGSERVAPLVLRARYGGRVVFRCGLVVPPSRMPLGEAVALSAGGLVEI
ncbi:MAG: aminotransferase class III-fold pyridoxal phosphate-dependent enzyme [Holophagales bacterium]|nr:MAG: aminotransferase class III-fold pyridoxal phosphate-dependent enzyme [Holophagales bacterium]